MERMYGRSLYVLNVRHGCQAADANIDTEMHICLGGRLKYDMHICLKNMHTDRSDIAWHNVLYPFARVKTNNRLNVNNNQVKYISHTIWEQSV